MSNPQPQPQSTVTHSDRYWREAMAPYAKPILWRSVLDIMTSVVPFFIGWGLMYWALDISYWLVLAISIPTAGCLLRTFILFHDCTHGSFFESKAANTWGGRFFGLLVFQCFGNWRHHHALHHGSAGDLDRRGDGDVPTWTVDEYFSKPFMSRLGYRLFRNPVIMFGIGPIWSLLVGPRVWANAKSTKLRNSILLTNLAVIVMVGGLMAIFGVTEVLLIYAPLVLIAGTAGVWLFFVQHQFEDVYWENSDAWSYSAAALQGSSYLKLPQPFQFFTGNIGLHHVHHLSSRVPNYSLQRAHDEVDAFADVPVLTFGKSLRCSRLKLWDERSKQLVTFREGRRSVEQGPAPRPAPAPTA
ncbi:MAG: fatty acid desaturase [Solirubrobacterales bacterium]